MSIRLLLILTAAVLVTPACSDGGNVDVVSNGVQPLPLCDETQQPVDCVPPEYYEDGKPK